MIIKLIRQIEGIDGDSRQATLRNPPVARCSRLHLTSVYPTSLPLRPNSSLRLEPRICPRTLSEMPAVALERFKISKVINYYRRRKWEKNIGK